MKKSPLVGFLTVIVCAWLLLAAAPPQEDPDSLWKLYLIEAEKFRTPPGAVELKSIRIFPPENDAADAVTIGEAAHFAQDNRGRIFIPDRRGGEVVVFDSQGKFQFKFGQTGQGPGEFIRPSNLFIWDDRILVRDISTMRFQFFDLNGRYLRGFKALKGYHSFFVRGERIFAAPALNRPPEPDRGSGLIEVLDFEGRVLKSFGAPLDVPKYDYSLLNSVRLAIAGDGSLIVAFQFFPTIRRYSMDGTLLNEIRLESGISEKIVPLNAKMVAHRYRGEQVPCGFIINSIYSDEDGLYVATAAPRRFEILLLGREGKIVEYYYRNLKEALGCDGLLVRKQGAQKEFYVLRMYPESSVKVMMGK
jgi:hypothetical protein